MYKTKIKAIALFSSVLVAVSSVSTSAVSALTSSSPPGDSNASFALKPGDLTPDELKTAALDDDDLPETISPSEALQNGHVNRLYEQEQDLNTVIFQNRAGDKTAYIYSYPVKYIDENGEVKDKKSDLTEDPANGYAYMSDSNDIKAHFPDSLSDQTGVTLAYDDVDIQTSPVYNDEPSVAAAADAELDDQVPPAVPEISTDEIAEKSVDSAVYEGVFGEGTRVKYTPQPEGYKESIILDKNTGTSKFSYKLKTGGLKLVREFGDLYLVDPDTEEIRVSISDVLVYDARVGDIDSYEVDVAELGAMNDGYNHGYEITELEENSEYLLTVSVDPAYLNAPDTVYPVVVDPTYTYKDNGTAYPLNSIMDVTLSKGKPDKNYGNTQRLTVGNYDKRYPDEAPKYGRCRALIAFSTLKISLKNASIPITTITSAQAHLKTIKNNTDSVTIKASKFTENWLETNATANSAWDLRGANISSTVVKGTGWYSWDILSCVEDGISGNISSIMLCAANTTDKAKEFASCQNSSVASRPYVTVNYNIPIQYLVVDSSSITPLHPGGTLKPKVLYFPENATDTALTYSSDNSNVATVNSNGLITGISDGYATITVKAVGSLAKTEISIAVSKILSTVCINDFMHDHTGFTSYTSFETMRANKPTIYDKYIDISKDKMPQIYYNSHFMIFRGHGNKYGITLDDYDFTTTDMNNLAQLSTCELVLYACCSTAEGGETADNFAKATLNKGAKTVIGFRESIDCSKTNKWLDYFFYALKNGQTVQLACKQASENMEERYGKDQVGSTDTWVVFGDPNIKIQ